MSDKSVSKWWTYTGPDFGPAKSWTLTGPDGARIATVESTTAGYVGYVLVPTSGDRSIGGKWHAIDAVQWCEEQPEVRALLGAWETEAEETLQGMQAEMGESS